MADRFAAWRGDIPGPDEHEWVGDLLNHLSPSPSILELGCGGASETTLRLSERGELLGIDISAEQILRAKERCPRARFIEGDFTRIELDDGSFDAVVSVYALNHVPRADLPRLLSSVAGWLGQDGWFLGSFGRSGGEGIEEDWLGVPMFFASFTEDENRALVRAAGLEVERDEVVTIDEPEYGEARFQWILAKKP